MPVLAYKPVTGATRQDFEALFGGKGGPRPCWCMTWRASAEDIRTDNSGAARRQAILGRIDDGVPLGLIGYAGGEPVAWVSIAPRESFRNIGGPALEEGERIWSLSCMYLRRPFRGRGIGHELIAEAVRHAEAHDATAVEAYPVDPDSPSYRFMGFVPAFEAAGFEQVGIEGTRRRVMRLTLNTHGRAKG